MNANFAVPIQGYGVTLHAECGSVCFEPLEKWRKRVGVEPTGDRVTCRPPVLKITWCVLNGCENLLLYLILQPFTRNTF